MGVQIFQDPKDRQFWVIGSAVGVNPATLVQDVQRRCKPSSIKLVMITQVEALWLRVLAPLAPGFFQRYLKTGLGLVWLDQTNVLMSVPSQMSVAKEGFLPGVAKALGTMAERAQTDLTNQVRVVSSADASFQQMAALQAKSQEFAMLQNAANTAMQAISTGLANAAQKN